MPNGFHSRLRPTTSCLSNLLGVPVEILELLDLVSVLGLVVADEGDDLTATEVATHDGTPIVVIC